MYCRKVTYTDFNDKEQTEDLYFHIGKGEILDMEKAEGTSLSKILMDLQNKMDGAKIINMCQTIIIKSYGVKSDDGKHFWKRPEILQEFMYSAAYDQLLYELTSDPSEALAFLAGILPLDNAQKEAIKQPLAEVKEAVEEAKTKLAEEAEAKIMPIIDNGQ